MKELSGLFARIPGPVQAHLWVLRGLRDGVVTTRYPGRPDGYGPAFRAGVVATPAGPVDPAVAAICPTGSIGVSGGLSVDPGRCIVCGRCVASRPDLFRFESSAEVAFVADGDGDVETVRADLARRVRGLRRSIHVRHVDAGSDGSEEWEVAALTNPVYDVQRLGVFFTASPRHADLLLVTGAGTAGMVEPLRRTWAAMPDPKVAVAAGTDAASGGLVHPNYATRGGVGDLVPVDVWVPGSPPSPFSLLHGILLAVGLLGERGLR